MFPRHYREYFDYCFKAATILTILVVWTTQFRSNKSTTNEHVSAAAGQTHDAQVVKTNIESQPPDPKKRQLEYAPDVNGNGVSIDNFYISRPEYKARLTPAYFSAPEVSLYQLSTYYAAGELARRYHARYLVDVGCGGGSKLAPYRHEFQLIGIDYKANLETVAKNHPYIRVLEVDLDQESDCLVDISLEVLSQAVVISADVIEHLVNPFHCYMRILQEFSQHALALVVSSPDRYRLYTKLGHDTLSGPPNNVAHVREWIVQELDILFLDHGMVPVASGWQCAQGGTCGKGLTPDTNTYSTSILIMANSQVRAKWLEEPTVLPQVFTFLTVTEGVHDNLLDFNLNYLTSQGIQICLLVIGAWEDSRNRSLPILRATDMNHAARIIEVIVNAGTFGSEDWIFIQGAHEVVSFPQSPALNLSLSETLARIGNEPYGFNAVAASTFFTHDTYGVPYPNDTLKMFGLHSWNPEGGYSLDNLRPAVETLKHRVHFWKRGHFNVSLTVMDTTGSFVITDVLFSGRNVYPYHAQILRFHPSFDAPYIWLTPDMRRLHILESTLGYYEANREELVVNKYPY